MRRLRILLNALFLAGALLLFAASYVWAAPPQQDVASDGQQIFQQKCTGCHTIGAGKLVGPDLQGVTTRRTPAWIKTFITDPAKMIASGDPAAKQLQTEYTITMPTLGLTPAEVDALVTYLTNPGSSTVGKPAPVAPVSPAVIGFPDRGRQIFTGEIPLKGTAPNCISCHTVAGIGLLNGGTLGPDLTHVIQRYGGEAGLATTLATLPFPTMQGIFATRPLSPEEQADLLAFFMTIDTQYKGNAPPVTNLFWAGGATGLIILIVIMAFFWPRQRQSLSSRLRDQGKQKTGASL